MESLKVPRGSQKLPSLSISRVREVKSDALSAASEQKKVVTFPTISVVAETVSLGNLEGASRAQQRYTFTGSDGEVGQPSRVTKQKRATGVMRKPGPQAHRHVNAMELKTSPLTQAIEQVNSHRLALEDKNTTTKGLLVTMGHFSTVADMVKSSINWKPSDQTTDAADVFFTGYQGKLLTFDKNNFARQRRTYGGLTSTVREALDKEPSERDAKDIKQLVGVIDRINCFDLYPSKIRQSIAKNLRLARYNTERVVIQQGHLGHAFYFVVRGSVRVQVTSDGHITQGSKYHVVSQMAEGASFGEMAIVFNIKRTAMVVANEPTELLYVTRHDLRDIFNINREANINERLLILEKMDLTKKLSFRQLVTVNKQCNLMEYEPGTVIFGNTTKSMKVYHIVKGCCLLVRDLFIVDATDRFGYRYQYLASERDIETLPLNKEIKPRERNARSLQRHIWTFRRLLPGAFFGVGEDLTHSYVIAHTNVECLLLSRIMLSRRGKSYELNRIKENLYIPTNKELLQMYKKADSWEKYKRSLVLEIAGRHKRSGAMIRDIPASIKTGARISLGED